MQPPFPPPPPHTPRAPPNLTPPHTHAPARFHEEMLDCCHTLERVREEGITLTQAACLARCNGARVEEHPYASVTLAKVRALVAEACASAVDHIIVSYTRKQFDQTGGW